MIIFTFNPKIEKAGDPMNHQKSRGSYESSKESLPIFLQREPS
jgi:hypothetical protein